MLSAMRFSPARASRAMVPVLDEEQLLSNALHQIVRMFVAGRFQFVERSMTTAFPAEQVAAAVRRVAASVSPGD